MTASTVAVAASAAHLVPKPYEASIYGTTLTASLATTSLDDVGDIVELGYIPANVTVLGFIINTASLAASALVYKIQFVAGGTTTDIVTSITTGSGAGSAFWGISPAPITTTQVTKVQINITTVATTPAAGVFNLTPLMANL
jgi:hypothetical protein